LYTSKRAKGLIRKTRIEKSVRSNNTFKIGYASYLINVIRISYSGKNIRIIK
jgi:hypothetical protein